MKKPLWLESVGSLLVYVVVYLYALYPYADPDWGWHFRYGEFFFKHGKLLLTNPFSWPLSDYRWVNPSWAYDEVVYLIYHYWGFVGFSFLGAFVVTLIFYVTIQLTHLHFWQKAILAFFYLKLAYLSTFQGLRSQMFASVFFALTFYLITKLETKSKIKYAIPIVFFIFANVHGLFIVSLTLFAVYIAIRTIDTYRMYGINGLKSRSFLTLPVLFAASCLTTLFNPFTYHIYTETLKHWGNPTLTYIDEWFPIMQHVCKRTDGLCQIFWAQTIFIMFSCGLIVIKFRRRLPMFYMLASLLLLYLAFSSQRYLLQLSIVSIPLVAITLSYLTDFAEKYFLIPIICIAVLAIFIFQIDSKKLPMFLGVPYGYYEYCQFDVCPEKAVQYLIKHPPIGNGFTYYDWGGYLIGRGLPAKVFVDGRMTVWQDHGINPFMDFIKIYESADFKTANSYAKTLFRPDVTIFNRYNFQWILIQNDHPLINTLLHDPAHRFGVWEVHYADPIAVYLVRVRMPQIQPNAFQY